MPLTSSWSDRYNRDGSSSETGLKEALWPSSPLASSCTTISQGGSAYRYIFSKSDLPLFACTCTCEEKLERNRERQRRAEPTIHQDQCLTRQGLIQDLTKAVVGQPVVVHPESLVRNERTRNLVKPEYVFLPIPWHLHLTLVAQMHRLLCLVDEF